MFEIFKRKKEVQKSEEKKITVTVNDEATEEELAVYDINVKVDNPDQKEVVEIELSDEKEDYFDEDFRKSLMDMYPGMQKEDFQKKLYDACSNLMDSGSKVLTDAEKAELALKKKEEEETVTELLGGDEKDLQKKQEKVLKDAEIEKAKQDEIDKSWQEYYDNQ